MSEIENLKKELEETCIKFKKHKRELYQSNLDFLQSIENDIKNHINLCSVIDKIKIEVFRLRECISYC